MAANLRQRDWKLAALQKIARNVWGPAYENDFDETERLDIENFCLKRVCKIIEAIDPLKIVIIGFRTQELFDMPWRVDLKNEKQALTRIGEVAGRPAIATTHLTGTYGLNAADLNRIRDTVLAR